MDAAGTPTDSDGGTDRRPEPPFSVDLLADYHADVLPADVAHHISRRLPDDPHAQTVLEALDRTVADLRRMPLLPADPPPHVEAMTTRTLAAIRDEVSGSRPAPVLPIESARTFRRPARWLAAGAVAAAVAGVLAISFFGPHRTETGTSASKPSIGVQGPDRATLLSVLGRSGHQPFESTAALRRCTAANGVPDTTPVVGSGPVTVEDQQAVVILLGTGVAGRFDALVVGTDCTAGHPSTISRTRIGG